VLLDECLFPHPATLKFPLNSLLFLQDSPSFSSNFTIPARFCQGYGSVKDTTASLAGLPFLLDRTTPKLAFWLCGGMVFIFWKEGEKGKKFVFLMIFLKGGAKNE